MPKPPISLSCLLRMSIPASGRTLLRSEDIEGKVGSLGTGRSREGSGDDVELILADCCSPHAKRRVGFGAAFRALCWVRSHCRLSEGLVSEVGSEAHRLFAAERRLYYGSK